MELLSQKMINTPDNYIRFNLKDDFVNDTNYTLLFNAENINSSDVIFCFPRENYNNKNIKNGYNIIKFTYNISSSDTNIAYFDDYKRASYNQNTFWNFFLYNDSEVDYLDKSNITFSNSVSSINLYALWAKVES